MKSRRPVSEVARRILGVGAIWALAWPAVGLLLVIVMTFLVGDRGDVGPLDIVSILGPLGLGAGVVFGTVVTILQPGTPVARLSYVSAVAVGILAAAVVGLIAGLQPTAVLNACVLGALSAPVTIVVARSMHPRALSA